MDEIEYLREGGAVVSSTRIEINGQTFAVRNVGSVKVTRPNRPWGALVVGVIGAAVAIGSSGLAGAIILGAAAAWAWQQMRTRSLVLVTGGGESTALKSTDGALVERLRQAVAQAISVR